MAEERLKIKVSYSAFRNDGEPFVKEIIGQAEKSYGPFVNDETANMFAADGPARMKKQLPFPAMAEAFEFEIHTMGLLG